MHHWALLFKTSEIYAAVVIITLIFVVLSVGFVVFIINYKMKQGLHLKEKKRMAEAFEKQLMQSQIEIQEATFEELGNDLHDNVGQLLSSTKLLLGVTQRALLERPDSLNLAVETLGQAIHELRSLTKSLDREWLAQFSLITNLQTEINRINAAKALNIQFVHPVTLPLETQKQIILFRVVQEALQNAIKHSGAAAISIEITAGTDFIIIAVNDDGRGLDGHDFSVGLGIRNMKKRMLLLGGTIDWCQGAGGLSVNIILPFTSYDQEN